MPVLKVRGVFQTGISLLEDRLHDFKTALHLKWWPSLQDYNEAIQIPQVCLLDPALKKSLPYTTALGLPRPITGAFASVYRMHCDDGDYALRLFLKNLEDQAKRYASISHFVQHDSLPYTVTFDFLDQGIKIRSDWFPALKMEWVEGTPFEEYVIENLNHPEVLGELSESFVRMMNEMRYAGIAHGDLQHGNIIMCGKELRLVDYDGMYVPALKHFMASEVGHPNYQHPSRGAHHFGPYLDNFSAWIIYASLRGLQLDPALLHQLGGGDDCLLFRRSDFLDPLQSPAFAAFEKHANEEIKMLGSFVRAQLHTDPEKIPYLQLPVPEVKVRLESIPNTVSSIKSGPRLVRGDTADWLSHDNLGALQKPGVSKPQSFNHYAACDYAAPGPRIIQAKAAHQSVWVKPTAKPTPTSTPTSTSTSFVNVHHGGASTNSQINVLPPIPQELTNNPTPRPVTYVKSNSRMSPVAKQWMMILFPPVWITLLFLFKGVTVDEELRVNAKPYDATISSVNRYETSSKNGPVSHTDVGSFFKVNHKAFFVSRDMGPDYGKYKKGDVYPVYALPSNPNVQEPFGAGPGTTKTTDLWWSVFFFLMTAVMELWIWFTPIRHRLMATYGTPVLANVKSLNLTVGSKGERTYSALVSYSVFPQTYKAQLNVSANEYHALKIGDTEIMLYDDQDVQRPLFYRFLLYHPVLPSSSYPTITSARSSGASQSTKAKAKLRPKPKIRP
jgi:hypothetical protein